MSYQAVVNLIRNTCAEVNPTGFFQHGRTWDASLNFDEGNPQIYLYPLQNTVDIANSHYENWSVLMGFFFQDSQDSTTGQRETLISKADALQRTFIKAIDSAEGIAISGIRTEPKYRQMAGTYSGVLLAFTLGTTTDACADEDFNTITNAVTTEGGEEITTETNETTIT